MHPVSSSTYPVELDQNHNTLLTGLAFDQALAIPPGQDVLSLGQHEVCGGSFVLQRGTTSHNVVRCEKCAWRQEVPNIFKYFGGLLKHLEQRAHKAA